MCQRVPLLLVLCLLLGAAVEPASAQVVDPAARFLGRTVTNVEIDVEGTLRDMPTLQAVISPFVGQPLQRAAWRPIMSRLAALGQFDDVELVVSDVDGGLLVVFRLKPRHPVDSFRFTGDTGIAEAELRQLVGDWYLGVPTGESIEDVATVVEGLLFEEGYQNASVTPSKEETHDPDRATLVLHTEAGPPVVVATVNVVGASPYSPATVQSRAGVVVGQRYRRRDVRRRMLEVEASLRDDQYYGAIARWSSEIRPDDGRVDVTLLVEAGPRVILRVVGELPGDEAALIPLARDRSADIDILEDSRRAIEAELRRQGFRDASAPFQQDESTDGSTVTITYEISRGRRYRIASVEVAGAVDLPAGSVDQELDLLDGAPFSDDAVTNAGRRLVVALQALGYHQAEVDWFHQYPPADEETEQSVLVRFEAEAGPRADVSEIAFELGDSGQVATSDLLAVMAARAGQPFVLSHGIGDYQRLERLYRDLGFPSPTVLITPEFADDGQSVRLVVTVTEGEQFFVGRIDVVGNEAISRAAVLETLTLQAGSPLGEANLLQSRRRLFELGIFRQVRIEPQPTPPGETVADVIVSVEELPNNTLGFGGGLEVGRRPRAATEDGQTDILEFAPRGFFEVGRRNIGGRNRQVNLFSRLALKPRRSTDGDDDSRFGFTEYLVSSTFREQRAFQTDTNLLIGLTFEQGVRTLYNFARRAVNAEALRRLTPTISVSGRWALDFSRLFDVGIEEEDRSLIDRLFPQVRLSLFSTGLVWDQRNDAIAPTGGSLLTGDLEFAVRSLGSEVGYSRLFLQASNYRTVTTNQRVVFATRAQLGVARGYERTVPIEDEFGEPVNGPDGAPLTETVADLPASQRFFAGGGTTVRGFQIDRLGVPEILNDNGLSNGGNAVVVLNAELRAHLGRDFGVVGFLDAGNVFAKARDLDLARLRSALGFGVRYDSPIGPLRLDLGFKTRRSVVGGRLERGWEYHLSIGEAF